MNSDRLAFRSRRYRISMNTPIARALKLTNQKTDNPLERIEAERGGDRWAQVRVGVDVVEDPPAIVRVQILDSTDVEPGRLDDPSRGLHGFWRHVRIWKELDRYRCNDSLGTHFTE